MTTIHEPRPASRVRRLAAVSAVLAMCLGAALAQPAAAQRWVMRGYGLWMSPGGDEISAIQSGARARFRLGDGAGPGLEVEYRWNAELGLELTAFLGEVDAELRLESAGLTTIDTRKLGTETYSLGVNYHFRRRGRGELAVGAFAGLSYYADVTFRFPALARSETFRFDDDLGFGLKAAVDLPFGAAERWLASAALRYQASILEGEIAGQDMDVDPLMISLGVGYRF